MGLSGGFYPDSLGSRSPHRHVGVAILLVTVISAVLLYLPCMSKVLTVTGIMRVTVAILVPLLFLGSFQKCQQSQGSGESGSVSS